MDTLTLAPGARIVVRDEEWLVRRTHRARPGGSAIQVTGLSELVRGKEAIFLTDLETIRELAPEDTALVADDSPHTTRETERERLKVTVEQQPGSILAISWPITEGTLWRLQPTTNWWATQITVVPMLLETSPVPNA